jgi:hypothetical protein
VQSHDRPVSGRDTRRAATFRELVLHLRPPWE